MQEDTERNREIQRLRIEEFWTLKMLSDKFGISRERARVISKVTGRDFVKKLHTRILESNHELTNSEMAEKFGVSESTVMKYRKKRHAIEDCEAKKGSEIEEFVSQQLTKMGIKNELMPNHHPFDILLENGFRIDVKSTYVTAAHSVISKSRRFFLHIEKRGHYADFFILVLRDTKEMFVVPFDEVPKNGTAISFCWPKEIRRGRVSRWEKFLNRFDLLNPALKEQKE